VVTDQLALQSGFQAAPWIVAFTFASDQRRCSTWAAIDGPPGRPGREAASAARPARVAKSPASAPVLVNQEPCGGGPS
jgi:hypothetical protein